MNTSPSLLLRIPGDRLRKLEGLRRAANARFMRSQAPTVWLSVKARTWPILRTATQS